MTLKKIYANLDASKTEALDDGTIKVWGFASAETEDSDGETITADAMKAALPDYLKWGAVREMHQPKAAGTAIEASVQGDGKTWFGAHVVDSEAVKKVKTGVYKGFSIGGKVTARDELNKAIIKGLKLIEVSLVDRPANPEAVLTMYKAETVDDPATDKAVSAVDELAELLDKGTIAPEALLALAKGTSNVNADKNDAVEMAADGGDFAKVSAAHDDLLKAICAAGCPENVVASEFIKAMAIERDDLKNRVAELEALPAPGKAMLKAIAKSADAGGVETDDANKVDPVTDSKGEVNVVATLIKSIHAGKAA